MAAADLHYLSLDEVARRLKARKLSSVEATRAILDRIETLDPKLKSYATVTAERALQDAARLDAETAAGTSRGPLHGVPIAVKDLCNTAGGPPAWRFTASTCRPGTRRSWPGCARPAR
jgi:amidase